MQQRKFKEYWTQKKYLNDDQWSLEDEILKETKEQQRASLKSQKDAQKRNAWLNLFLKLQQHDLVKVINNFNKLDPKKILAK